MKVIFLGTGDFSLTVLKAVHKSAHEVVAVVAQPDKVNARNGKKLFSPVKSYALEEGLKLFQFEKINNCTGELRPLGADIMITSAYGQLLSREVLALCRYGVINTHASLLPAYRGAAPIQSAILNGDEVIGTTIMRTEYEMDTGDIILQRSVRLRGDENSEECFGILAELSAALAVEALDEIERGIATYTPQDDTRATYCRKFVKEDGKMDFSLTAAELARRVRAFYGFPGTFCNTPNGRLKVIKAEVSSKAPEEGVCGEVVAADKQGITVRCGGNTALTFLVVQGEGARAMSARDYLLGKKLPVGTVLG